jgi:hypothetical protein
MKKTIITLAALLAATVAYSQGTVTFNTLGPGVNAVVSYGSASERASGDSFWGALYFQKSGTTDWVNIGTPKNFGTGGTAGYILAGTQSGATAGDSGTLQFRAWASSKVAGGSDAWSPAWPTTPGVGPGYGVSVVPSTVTLGGAGSPPSLPAALTGLTGFTMAVVPEPSFMALGLLGAGLLLIRRKK